ncbi:MAG: putative small protein [Sphingomonadales bacterium]|jgi:uncharacterized protein YodC (DUF2158 family)|nr:putative small protein [Sphingomonadales bacterium]
MPNDFKKGDIVQLRSGGPKMTVEQDWGDEIRVAWFAGAKMEVQTVHPDALQPYVEPESKK